MEVYKRPSSKYWLVDFTVNGKRHRKSTRATTKTRAMEVAADLIRQAQQGDSPKPKGPSPRLDVFAQEVFLPFIRGSQLDPDTKRYYQNGWRMLQGTSIAEQRINGIKSVHAAQVDFPGSGSNANCALRTLRRMLSLAQDLEHIASVPKIKLRKGRERSATFTPELELAFLAVAPEPLKDVFLISEDSGAPRRDHSDALGPRPVGQEPDLQPVRKDGEVSPVCAIKRPCPQSSAGAGARRDFNLGIPVPPEEGFAH